MANVKKGNITPAPQWWKHLKDWKRVFWKAERQAQKNMMPYRVEDDYSQEEHEAIHKIHQEILHGADAKRRHSDDKEA